MEFPLNNAVSPYYGNGQPALTENSLPDADPTAFEVAKGSTPAEPADKRVADAAVLDYGDLPWQNDAPPAAPPAGPSGTTPATGFERFLGDPVSDLGASASTATATRKRINP